MQREEFQNKEGLVTISIGSSSEGFDLVVDAFHFVAAEPKTAEPIDLIG
jgi:hypothetical protein